MSRNNWLPRSYLGQFANHRPAGQFEIIGEVGVVRGNVEQKMSVVIVLVPDAKLPGLKADSDVFEEVQDADGWFLVAGGGGGKLPRHFSQD
jgi:hypothetical protein